MAEQDFLRFLAHGGLRVDVLGERIGALDRRPLVNGVEPPLEIRKILKPLTLSFIGDDPGIGGHIRNGVLSSDEGTVSQTPIEHTVQPVGLFHVAFDRIGNFLGRVVREMMVLPGHGPEPAHLPEQPLKNVGPPAQITRHELAGLLREINQDGAGLEHADRRAAPRGIMVDDRGHAVVRRNPEELRPELLARADVHRDDPVRGAGLFEEDRDLVTVGRRPIVQVDHRHVSGVLFSGSPLAGRRQARNERQVDRRRVLYRSSHNIFLAIDLKRVN